MEYDISDSMYDLRKDINERLNSGWKLHSVVCNPRSWSQEEEFIAIYVK